MRTLVCSAYFKPHRRGIEIVAGQLVRAFLSLAHSVSWFAVDASSPPLGFSADGRTVPLRTSNVSERWLQIPWPIAGLSALRIIKREAARPDDARYLLHLLVLMLARAIAASIRLRPARHGAVHNG